MVGVKAELRKPRQQHVKYVASSGLDICTNSDVLVSMMGGG